MGLAQVVQLGLLAPLKFQAYVLPGGVEQLVMFNAIWDGAAERIGGSITGHR